VNEGRPASVRGGLQLFRAVQATGSQPFVPESEKPRGSGGRAPRRPLPLPCRFPSHYCVFTHKFCGRATNGMSVPKGSLLGRGILYWSEELAKSRVVLFLWANRTVILPSACVILAAIWLGHTIAWNRNRAAAERTVDDALLFQTVLAEYRRRVGDYPEGPWVQALGDIRIRLGYSLQRQDGWYREYVYVRRRIGPADEPGYILYSNGSDGEHQGYVREYPRYFECDVILQDGRFVQGYVTGLIRLDLNQAHF